MKISVYGYSGSGKSTLAHYISEVRGIPVLHLDSVHWLPGWQVRSSEDKHRIVGDFMDSNDSWVIDGNYSKLYFDRRNAESDEIILLLFCRISCLVRVIKRYFKYKNFSRPDMGEGCNEKIDWEFVKWVLWEGRSKIARERYRRLILEYGDKVTVIKNQRNLDRYMNKIKQNAPE